MESINDDTIAGFNSYLSTLKTSGAPIDFTRQPLFPAKDDSPIDPLRWGLIPYWCKARPEDASRSTEGGDGGQPTDFQGSLWEAAVHHPRGCVLRV
jgi:hypothetical protein